MYVHVAYLPVLMLIFWLQSALTKEIEELTVALRRRDEENGRLRQQRDQQMAEISERKAKIASKFNQIEDLKALTELQAVCTSNSELGACI